MSINIICMKRGLKYRETLKVKQKLKLFWRNLSKKFPHVKIWHMYSNINLVCIYKISSAFVWHYESNGKRLKSDFEIVNYYELTF